MRHIPSIEAAYDDWLEEVLSLDTLFSGRKVEIYKEYDATAYRVGFADFSSQGGYWECPECNEWYELETSDTSEYCDDCLESMGDDTEESRA